MPLIKHRQPVPDDPSEDRGVTIVDHDITLVGQIISEEDIRVRGRVEGNVSSTGSVIVEARGFVRGDVTAANLTVAGSIEGMVVVARKFELRPSGRMRGDIRAAIVAIAEDSFLQGKVLATEKISTNVRKSRLSSR